MRCGEDLVNAAPAAVTGINMALLFHGGKDRVINIIAPALYRRSIGVYPFRALVKVKAHPGKVFQYALFILLTTAVPVNIFHAENDFSSPLSCPEPVEESNPEIAQMHAAGGTGSETATDIHQSGRDLTLSKRSLSF